MQYAQHCFHISIDIGCMETGYCLLYTIYHLYILYFQGKAVNLITCHVITKKALCYVQILHK